MVKGAPLSERYRITLALVRPLGQVSRLIRAILRSFQISYFSTNLVSFYCSSFNFFFPMRRIQCNLVVDPLHGISVPYYLSYGPLILFSKGSSASLTWQYCILALPVVMGYTGIAIMDTASEPGVRGTSFRAISQFIEIINNLLITL